MHAVLSMLALLVAPPEEWRVLLDQGTGSDHVLFLTDASSVGKPSPDMRTLAVLTFHAKREVNEAGHAYNAIQLVYRFDCKARTAQRIEAAQYMDALEIHRWKNDYPMQPIEPGSLSGDLFEPACTGNFSAYPRITAPTPAAERDRRFAQ